MSIDLDNIESLINNGIYGDDRMSVTERDDAFAALVILLAEVKRLQQMQPKRDYYASLGAAQERAAVVAWLRAEANEPHPIEAGERALSPSGRGLLLVEASRIERGEHRREENEMIDLDRLIQSIRITAVYDDSVLMTAKQVFDLTSEVLRLREHRESCTENLLKGYKTGKAEERAAVVAWLRWLRAEAYLTLYDLSPWEVSNAIERGDHVKEVDSE